MPKLKVFRTAIGFHDALVAAPSRKAALRAWGAEADLFARGVAEEVTEPALTAEPLARPGEVIRRSRGSVEEQLAALPPDEPKQARPAGAEDGEPAPVRPRKVGASRAAGSARQGEKADAEPPRASPPPPPPPKPRPPRPDPAALDAAEDALAAVAKRHRAALADLAERERALARERRNLEGEQADEIERLTRKRDAARRAYDAGMRAWRGAS